LILVSPTILEITLVTSKQGRFQLIGGERGEKELVREELLILKEEVNIRINKLERVSNKMYKS
jgi:hypothetical protein